MLTSSPTMLKKQSLQPGLSWSGHLEPSSYLTLAEIGRFFRRFWLTITLPIVLSLIVTITYSKWATPIFTARTQIIIDPRGQDQWQGQSGNAVLALDTAQVESQIAVLRSEGIANGVLKTLDLINAEDFQPRPSLLQRLIAVFRGSTPMVLTDLEKARAVIESFNSNLDVRRSGMSYAIDISFNSSSPKRAAEVANATAEAYIQHQLSARSKIARAGGDWLEQRTLELRSQMSAATRAVQEFKARRDYRLPQASATDPPEDRPKSPYTLEELETTAQIYQRVYESFLQGFMEAVQRQSFPVADARVLTEATAPLSKSLPRASLIVALGVLVSGLGGLGVALIRFHFDSTVRTAAQIRHELGIECLGSTPVATSKWRRQRKTPGLPATFPAGYFAGAMAPSAFCDALLGVKEILEVNMRADKRLSFGVTSVRDGEGKTMLASNLATLFAASGWRTLIVDADVRKPTLSAMSEALGRPGLPDVLCGGVSIKKAAITLKPWTVDLLPVGSVNLGMPMLRQTTGAGALQLALGSHLKDYDVVIFDLPAMAPVNGALMLSSGLDGVLVAVEYGKTTVGMLAESVYRLKGAQAECFGAVITKSIN